jgi:hypothetical protein
MTQKVTVLLTLTYYILISITYAANHMELNIGKINYVLLKEN